MELQEKYENLKNILKNMQSALIAYSGGVDSTFLLKVAHDVLKDNVIAVTAKSSTYPEREFKEAVKYAQEIGAKHKTIISEELDIKGYVSNPKNRCYYCKKELFTKLKKEADNFGTKYVLDGSNSDDMNDYRPGMKAAEELGITSPLKEAGLTKDDIRTLSKKLDLPTWNKPSFACLSSRFPYGNKITKEKLNMIDRAETFLLDLGFKQLRVRCHDTIARIEISPDEMENFLNSKIIMEVNKKLKEIGFLYVTLDLGGYISGNMNKTLDNN
ncbi:MULTISPECIES: ATP-dependent sacrificial sulfur transferase LarE [Clostridium]|uniref:ATP-dependent sacrificial sulfur transferase LarE n=1 Tax=Clostridium TaxID=1485 RepID=UPI000824716E|nr:MULTISPECIES: ATP-dependent sacrificial sulfur transferase LarE [Clostridium]PJI08829.1 TIGR00268 family protein [Clostridium sp. CT7]